MGDIQQVWKEHADPFGAVVEEVRDWSAASPCEGWSAADVLDHVISTERDFLGGQGHELPATTNDDPAARWREHAGAVTGLLQDQAVAGQEYDGAFGRTTVGDTLARFYGFDLLVHRWDIARSQGRDEELTVGELAEINTAVDGFGEHAYGPGVFKSALDVPADASEQTRTLARTGRAG